MPFLSLTSDFLHSYHFILFWSPLTGWPVDGLVSPSDSWRSGWLTICWSKRPTRAKASYWICCFCGRHWPETPGGRERDREIIAVEERKKNKTVRDHLSPQCLVLSKSVLHTVQPESGCHLTKAMLSPDMFIPAGHTRLCVFIAALRSSLNLSLPSIGPRLHSYSWK